MNNIYTKQKLFKAEAYVDIMQIVKNDIKKIFCWYFWFENCKFRKVYIKKNRVVSLEETLNKLTKLSDKIYSTYAVIGYMDWVD